MSRKFNSTAGLLAIEHAAIVIEPADQGVDVSAELLFGDVHDGQWPEEVTNILVYFPEDTATEIAAGTPTITLEHVIALLDDIRSVQKSMHACGGVNRALALECERLTPGFFTDEYPLKSFSVAPTLTNWNYTTENFDVKSAAIIGAIIAIILGIAKLMFGGGSGGGGGGDNGAAAKVDDKIDKMNENADKLAESLAAVAAKATPEVIRTATSGHYKVDGLDKDDPLNGLIDTLNEHIKEGISGLDTFALRLLPEDKHAVTLFWKTMGAGNYTQAVISLNGYFEELADALKAVNLDGGPLDTASVGTIKAAISTVYAGMRTLALFEDVKVDPSELSNSLAAARKLFEQDPSRRWLDEFQKLKNIKHDKAYTTLLTKSVHDGFWSGSEVWRQDFLKISDESRIRREVNKRHGQNATAVFASMQKIFKTASKSESASPANINEQLGAEQNEVVQHAFELCSFILRVNMNLSRIFNEVTGAVKAMNIKVGSDINTIARISSHQENMAKKA